MFIVTNTHYIKVLIISSHKVAIARLSKTKKLYGKALPITPLYTSKEEWSDYYPHSYTSMKLSHLSITNQWDHATYYCPTINIHLWMNPFLFGIYFLW
jgi:hypothetical protein